MMIPTSLYIHIPWCIKKCPYCDFNSHEKHSNIDEMHYVTCLVEDFVSDWQNHPCDTLHSIFIGGGTPSLFSPEAYECLLNKLKAFVNFAPNLEITLEANPGTMDSGRFAAYRQLGINRLSIGVQSFKDEYLKKLGRIHDAATACMAIETAQLVGFERINIDLMYGLPGQTTTDALCDLKQAVTFNTEHLSWYELTIEPNTVFYKKPPQQPSENTFIEIEQQGRLLLSDHGFNRYEISAYAKDKKSQCQHNLNYWTFGDYYGIGAGAHAKLTSNRTGGIQRLSKIRQPASYIAHQTGFIAQSQFVSNPADVVFEFMLNVGRLIEPIAINLFSLRTGLDLTFFMPGLKKAEQMGFVKIEDDCWQLSTKGQQYNNELVKLFLEK
jgi:putative oxygen-independent coproporphyrinogen III oxidase